MRVQFSITMDADVKEKVERLAAIENTSFSMLIEDLCRARIGSIEEKVWMEYAELRRKMSVGTATKSHKKVDGKK